MSCKHINEWPPGPDEWFPGYEHEGNRLEEKICAQKEIGKGGFGIVYLGHRNFKGYQCPKETWAIKVIPFTESKITSSSSSTKSMTKQRAKLEVDVHENLKDCQYVVKPKKISVWPLSKPKEAILCMEYCPKGDVNTFLKTRQIDEILVRNLTHNVVRGLKELKRIGYFHRDVKASNIFVSDGSQGEVFKLGDFGLVAKLDAVNTEICGTPSAMAPEIDGRTPYSLEVDIWALGILLYTKLIGRGPFNYDQGVTAYERIRVQREGWRFPENVYLSPSLKDLIKQMLTWNHTQRIDLESVEKHPFITMTPNQTQSESGYLTSSQISGMTNSTTNQFRSYTTKAPLLPTVVENSRIFRSQTKETFPQQQQPIIPHEYRYQDAYQPQSPTTMTTPRNFSSPMPSAINSRIVASLEPRLSTKRLRASHKPYKLKNGCAVIKTDGSVQMEFSRIKEVIQNGLRTQVEEKDSFLVSGDGNHIEIQKGSEEPKGYLYESLPSKYWSKYNFAAKIVSAARANTPKVTFFKDKFVWKLMENEPDPNFELTFYADGTMLRYNAAKDKIFIVWTDKRRREEQYSGQTRALDPGHELASKWPVFLKERERALRWEKTLSKEDGQECFPATFGKRPSSLSS